MRRKPVEMIWSRPRMMSKWSSGMVSRFWGKIPIKKTNQRNPEIRVSLSSESREHLRILVQKSRRTVITGSDWGQIIENWGSQKTWPDRAKLSIKCLKHVEWIKLFTQKQKQTEKQLINQEILKIDLQREGQSKRDQGMRKFVSFSSLQNYCVLFSSSSFSQIKIV